MLFAAAFFQYLLSLTTAAFDVGSDSETDLDLTRFVTQPDIRGPRFNDTLHIPELVEDGYWFVAPYAFVDQEKQARHYHQPCQTGPAIYDNQGDLVWSGACMIRNHNVYDFRAWNFDGSFYMSAILTPYPANDDPKGHGVVIDASCNIVREIHVPSNISHFNMHELNLLDKGKNALYILFNPVRTDMTELGLNSSMGWIADAGFLEADLVDISTILEWWAHQDGQVSLWDTKTPVRDLDGPYPRAFNWCIHRERV